MLVRYESLLHTLPILQIQVDFEALIPEEMDFHGIKMLLQQVYTITLY